MIKAVETYCKAVKEDNEIVKLVAEQKIRSMRLAGEMLKGTELRAGGRNIKGNQYTDGVVESESVTPPTLSDLGLSKNESSTYQKIASISLEDFEQEMEKVKEVVSCFATSSLNFTNVNTTGIPVQCITALKMSFANYLIRYRIYFDLYKEVI